MVTSETPAQMHAPQDSFLRAVGERASDDIDRAIDFRAGRVLAYAVLVVVIVVVVYAIALGRNRSFSPTQNAADSAVVVITAGSTG